MIIERFKLRSDKSDDLVRWYYGTSNMWTTELVFKLSKIVSDGRDHKNLMI